MNPHHGEQHMPGSSVPPETPQNPWDTFLHYRTAAIHWLRSEARLNDGEIAKAMSLNATDVFLLRTRPVQGELADDADNASTQAAPLGE